MKPGGRFIEEIERVRGLRAGEFDCELEPLRFAAGEGVRRLAELEVAEAELFKDFHQMVQFRNRPEKRPRVTNRHFQDLGDGFPLVGHFQRFAVEAPASACRTRDPCIGQEMHLDLEPPVSLAAFAATARRIETEAARTVSALLGERQLSEYLADQIEGTGECRGIRARTAADRRLVGDDAFADQIQPVNANVRSGSFAR